MATSSANDDDATLESVVELFRKLKDGVFKYRPDGIIDYEKYAPKLSPEEYKQLKKDEKRLIKDIAALKEAERRKKPIQNIPNEVIWVGTYGKQWFNLALEKAILQGKYDVHLPGTTNMFTYIVKQKNPNTGETAAKFKVSSEEHMRNLIFKPGQTKSYSTSQKNSDQLKTVDPTKTIKTTSSSQQNLPSATTSSTQQRQLTDEETQKVTNYALIMDNINQEYTDKEMNNRARKLQQNPLAKFDRPIADYQYVHLRRNQTDTFPLTKPKYTYYYPNRFRYGNDRLQEYELLDNLPSFEDEIYKGGKLSDNDDDDDEPHTPPTPIYRGESTDDNDDNFSAIPVYNFESDNDDDKPHTPEYSSENDDKLHSTTTTSTALTGSIQPTTQPLKPPSTITTPSIVPQTSTLPHKQPPVVKPIFEPVIRDKTLKSKPEQETNTTSNPLETFTQSLGGWIELPLDNYTLARLVEHETGKMYMYETYLLQLSAELNNMGDLHIMVYRNIKPKKDYIVQAFTQKFYHNMGSIDSNPLPLPEALIGKSPTELLLLAANIGNPGHHFTHVYPFHLYQTNIPLDVAKQPLNGDILALYTSFEIGKINFGNMPNMYLQTRSLTQLEKKPQIYETPSYVALKRGGIRSEKDAEIQKLNKQPRTS